MWLKSQILYWILVLLLKIYVVEAFSLLNVWCKKLDTLTNRVVFSIKAKSYQYKACLQLFSCILLLIQKLQYPLYIWDNEFEAEHGFNDKRIILLIVWNRVCKMACLLYFPLCEYIIIQENLRIMVNCLDNFSRIITRHIEEKILHK